MVDDKMLDLIESQIKEIKDHGIRIAYVMHVDVVTELIAELRLLRRENLIKEDLLHRFDRILNHDL